MAARVVVCVFLLSLVVPTAWAEPASPWQPVFTPDNKVTTAAVDGHGNVYTVEAGCMVKRYPSGPVDYRLCDGPDGLWLAAERIIGVAKGIVWLTRRDSPIAYRYTYDGRFVDLQDTEGYVCGAGVGRQIFICGATGGARLLNDGEPLADWPEKIAVGPTDARGNTYVSPEEGFSGPLRRISRLGEASTVGDGDVGQAGRMVLDGRGNVFVLDLAASVIRILSPEGKLLRSVGEGQLQRPAGLALGPDGTIYVADRDANKIKQFTPDGKLVGTYGEQGTTAGQFDAPTDVIYDLEGWLIERDQSGRTQRMRIVQPFTTGYKWP